MPTADSNRKIVVSAARNKEKVVSANRSGEIVVRAAMHREGIVNATLVSNRTVLFLGSSDRRAIAIVYEIIMHAKIPEIAFSRYSHDCTIKGLTSWQGRR
jgi:hypothetical protein